jgi:hypothetical protein
MDRRSYEEVMNSRSLIEHWWFQATLLAIGTILAVALRLMLWSDHAERLAAQEMPDAQDVAADRPAWYPFKFEPPHGTRVPAGNLKMGTEEAKRLFLNLFGRLTDDVLADPREPAFVKARLIEFMRHTREQNEVLIAAFSRYEDFSPSVPASTQPSKDATRPMIVFWMPAWAEYNRWFVEEYVRETFIETVCHEMAHAEQNFWRPEADHSREPKVRSEAEVRAADCENVFWPRKAAGLWTGVEGTTNKACDVYERAGRNPNSAMFLSHVANLTH